MDFVCVCARARTHTYTCVDMWACVPVETAGQSQMLSLWCCPPFHLFTFGGKFSYWLGIDQVVGLAGQ